MRCKRVVCSADLAQIKELQSLLQAELLQLEKEKGMGIKAVKGEDPGELRERVARLEARRSSLPQHVQALLAKVQAHVAAAVEGGGGDEEEQEAAQEHEGRKEVKEMATASPSSSSGGFADRQPSTASHRLAPSKPLKQRSRLPAMAFSQQAAVASHSLPRSFATVEQRTRNDDPSIISQEEEVEEERSGNHDEAPISSLGSAALPLSDAGGSTDSPASPAAASQPAVQEDEEGSDVEEVWTEEEKEEEEHFDDKEDGSLVTIQEEEGLE